MNYKLDTAFKRHGEPYTSFKTYWVVVDEQIIGTIQESEAGMKDNPKGDWLAWLGNGITNPQWKRIKGKQAAINHILEEHNK